jgi:hypothetical protein
MFCLFLHQLVSIELFILSILNASVNSHTVVWIWSVPQRPMCLVSDLLPLEGGRNF